MKKKKRTRGRHTRLRFASSAVAGIRNKTVTLKQYVYGTSVQVLGGSGSRTRGRVCRSVVLEQGTSVLRGILSKNSVHGCCKRIHDEQASEKQAELKLNASIPTLVQPSHCMRSRSCARETRLTLRAVAETFGRGSACQDKTALHGHFLYLEGYERKRHDKLADKKRGDHNFAFGVVFERRWQ